MKGTILILLLLTLVSSISLTVCVDQLQLTVGTIEIKDFSFHPDSITVPVGTTVTWNNGDQVSHTVTSNDGKFDSAAIKNGGEFNFTFLEPGTYNYYCRIHPSMKDVVTVIAA